MVLVYNAKVEYYCAQVCIENLQNNHLIWHNLRSAYMAQLVLALNKLGKVDTAFICICAGIVVAIIDGPVKYNHPDLSSNMWKNSGEVAGNGIDDDKNGYVDDVYGWNCVNETGNINWKSASETGHGTMWRVSLPLSTTTRQEYAELPAVQARVTV